MNMANIWRDAKRTGRIWFGGEMEIPIGGLHEAYRAAVHVAEECGYVATVHGTRRTITGGDIPGYVVLDWFNDPQHGPQKIELWTEEAAYMPDDLRAVPA